MVTIFININKKGREIKEDTKKENKRKRKYNENK